MVVGYQHFRNPPVGHIWTMVLSIRFSTTVSYTGYTMDISVFYREGIMDKVFSSSARFA